MLTQTQIEQKLQRLEEIKAELKQDFFGIDSVIDRVVESVTSWYILPEVIKSPVIINLWGLTGVGKTALVRSLVKKLGFKRQFVEIQMDSRSSGSGYWLDSISKVLQSSSVQEGEPGILLLDEFQRFRTVDQEGTEQKVERFQDVWTLLSDGKFAVDCELFSLIDDHINQEEFYEDRGRKDDEDDEDDDEAPKHKKPRKFKIYPYEAKSIKKLLGSKASVLEIMSWDKEKVTEMLRNRKDNDDPEELNFTKLLVFICGNLDEVFTVADSTSDTDTDADTFYNYTSKLNLFDVKRELLKRFKPEQISRFGNNHVIYPSLNKLAYQKIIALTCENYIRDAEAATGVRCLLTDSFLTEIYANSVYPTQGTRPVLSSINQIMGQSIPKVLLWALTHNYNPITLSIDFHTNSVVASSALGTTTSVPVYLDVKTAKTKISPAFRTLVAVHEAGHAVAYAVLFKVAPIQVNINVVSFSGGFNYYNNKIHSNYDTEIKRIQATLAGTVAEEIIFGEDYRSVGCGSDIKSATEHAAILVRQLSFNEEFRSYVVNNHHDESIYLNTDILETNSYVEKMISEQKSLVRDLLEENQAFLEELVDQLLQLSDIKKEQFIEIAKPFVPDMTSEPVDIFYDYDHNWKEFKNEWGTNALCTSVRK